MWYVSSRQARWGMPNACVLSEQHQHAAVDCWVPPLLRCLSSCLPQVDSEGRKFGKSTGGAIWLSAEKLSPYKFYQYLFQVSREMKFSQHLLACCMHRECMCGNRNRLNPDWALILTLTLCNGAATRFSCGHGHLQHQVTDADVIKFLRMLTFLPLEEIDALEQAMSQPDYAPNTAQRRLAEAVTRCATSASGFAA